MAKDPLGKQPRLITGNAAPEAGSSTDFERIRDVRKQMKSIFVPHRPHQIVQQEILLLHAEHVGLRGDPAEGRRLSQRTGAGKSTCAARVAVELAERRQKQGLPPNPFQVVIVGLEKKISLKSVMQDVLIKLEDPDWDVGTEKQLRQRIDDFVRRLDVELLIIDEVQHLKNESDGNKDVTDALKRWLDEGAVPIVLIGNEDAEPFFARNPQLAGRLGPPMTLEPLSPRSQQDRIDFKTFIFRFEQEIARRSLFPSPPCLTEPDILTALLDASGGFVGRAVRIIRHAASYAVAREALTIERFDLSEAVRRFAMPTWGAEHDPFSSQPN